MRKDAFRVAEGAWGDVEPAPAPWASGPWSLERRGDQLADIRYDGIAVLRMVRAVARDRNWDTVPSAVTSVSEGEDRLEVRLRLHGLGADFVGSLTAVAAAETLDVELELTAQKDFDRNRLGLIVLHPPSLAGASLRVHHPDGAVDETVFPVEISPHQPAIEIEGLSWIADGVEVGCRFSGEVFEMEDQRNWTDASYKTYSTPLREPFPVHVSSGDVIRHTLHVTARSIAPSVRASFGKAIVRAAGHAVPDFGLGASTAPDPLPTGVPTASFILVEPVVSTANWRAALGRAATEAAGTPLDVRIVADRPDEVAAVVAELRRLGAPVVRIGAFSPRTHTTGADAWAALRMLAPSIRADLVGGARSHFTELNRQHAQLPADLPALTFASTPQMHATERAQLVESIPMQRLTAEQAVRIAAGRPVHVGPITLRSRYNAVATTGPAHEPADLATGYGPQRVPSATDPRQAAPALEAWTIASAAAFAVAGVVSIAFFETCGPRGVRGLPVARAVEALHALSGRPLLTADNLPEGVSLLGASDASGTTVLLANLRTETTTVEFRLGAAQHAVAVGPLATARLDLDPAT